MKILLLAVTFILILIAQQNLIKADFIHDDANVIGNEAEIDNIIHDFYNKYDIIIFVDTVEETDNIQELARKKFFERGLDKSGTKELNMLVLYSKNTRELTIGHADKCSLESNAVFSVLRDEKVSSEVERENYNAGFLNVVKSLKDKLVEKVTNWFCELPPKIEFTVDSSIYEPPTKDNPYGLSLKKEWNPYDDGIVTVYDPLDCTLKIPGKTGSAVYSIKGIKSGVIDNGNVQCSNNKCTIKIPPERAQRGEEIECEINYKGQIYSDKLIVAQYIYIHVPVNIEIAETDLTLDKVYSLAKERYEYYVKLSKVNDEPGLMGKPLFLNQLRYDERIPGDRDIVAINIMNDIEKKMNIRFSEEHDMFILLSFWVSAADGYALLYQPIVTVAEDSTIVVTAHELGHNIGKLCHESSYTEWLDSNEYWRELLGIGCQNTLPECCKTECEPGPGCCKVMVGSVLECAGMPYDSNGNPHPEYENPPYPFFSIMGSTEYVAGSFDKLVYPQESKCPLGVC